mgnify:CR=1 FL=1
MEDEVDESAAYTPLNVNVSNMASEIFTSESLVILCLFFLYWFLFQYIYVEKEKKIIMTHFFKKKRKNVKNFKEYLLPRRNIQ